MGHPNGSGPARRHLGRCRGGEPTRRLAGRQMPSGPARAGAPDTVSQRTFIPCRRVRAVQFFLRFGPIRPFNAGQKASIGAA